MGRFKVWTNFDWVLLIIITFTFILSYYFSPQLPELVPTHWNIAGQIDGWGPKWVNLYFTPAISLFVLVLMSIVPLLDPLKKNYHDFAPQYSAFKILLVGFFTSLYFLLLYTSLHPTFNLMRFFPVIFGLLFMGVGWILLKLKPNWFIGIRTPWTISDETVWQKTHALGGKLFIGTGLLTVVAGLLFPGLSFIVSIPALIASGLGSVAYSYLLWRKRH